METISQLLLFFLALSVLVMAHEIGHLLFAKKFNVYCYEFSIGMGPRLFSKKYKETQYSIKLFPIGGSVMMAGEEFDEATKKSLGPLYDIEISKERTCYGIARWKRLFVFGGGALFNFVLGLLLLFIVVNINGYKADDRAKLNVDTSALVTGQLLDGDIITEVNILFVKTEGSVIVEYRYVAVAIKTYNELLGAIEQKDFYPDEVGEYQEVTFHGYRDVDGTDQRFSTNKIRRDYQAENGLSKFGFRVYTYPLKWHERISEPFVQFAEFSQAIIRGLASLFSGMIANVSGPIGLFQMSSQVATYGFLSYLSFLALLSINLGIFNLIPFPGLDGAAIFMTIGEMITRKEIPIKWKGIFNMVGILILLGLILLVSIKDIIQLF